MLKRTLDVSTSLLASSLRGWRGTAAFNSQTRQPEQALELYEFEGCPYCRLVREVLSELDLDAMIYPCPKNGQRFRPRAIELSGRAQFPLLVDTNTGTVMLESADIIQYLRQTYGVGGTGNAGGVLGRMIDIASSSLASGARGLGGMWATAENAGGLSGGKSMPEVPLELFSFESSPFSRIVRERLCELEIPYLLRNMPKAMWEDMGPAWVKQKIFPQSPMAGRNRLALKARADWVQVPYLIDANQGVEMFESQAIVAYLNSHYG